MNTSVCVVHDTRFGTVATQKLNSLTGVEVERVHVLFQTGEYWLQTFLEGLSELHVEDGVDDGVKG